MNPLRRIAATIGLAGLLLGLAVAPAAAAPVFDVGIQRDSAEFPTVHRGDERADYTVTVANTVAPGDVLACNTNTWTDMTPGLNGSFAFQWLRDGASLGAANGAQTASYTIQASDEGHSLQCLVKGTNDNAGRISVTAPLVVFPIPDPAPPAPTNPTNDNSRATITGTTTRTCVPPTAWSGSPTWTGFRWYRNGTEIPGEVGNTYVLQPADTNTLLQCTAIGENVSGKAIAVSNHAVIGSVTQFPNNTAANTPTIAVRIAPGDVLTCFTNTWANMTEELNGEFSFQWLRDGASLGAGNGAQTASYTIQASDEGHSLQCLVKGTNDNAGRISVTGPVVVPPPPDPLPPNPANLGNNNSRATITGTTTRTCNPPTLWNGSPTWGSYRWQRNGVEIPGEEGTTYELQPADTDTLLQCTVIGENAGGKALAASNHVIIGSVTQFPNNTAPNTPFISLPSEPNGPVTVEIELPGGLQTAVWSVSGGTTWVCSRSAASPTEAAKATCLRNNESNNRLAPGASYPAITVVAALGEDAPDHAVATATASGGGAAPASATSEFDFLPRRPFEIEDMDTWVVDPAGNDYKQAGGHPFSGSLSFFFPRYRQLAPSTAFNRVIPVERVRNIITDLPRGFVGNALAVPKLCPGLDEVKDKTCPPESAVGGIRVKLVGFGENFFFLPIYSIQPEFGRPAQFAFAVTETVSQVYTFAPRLRPEDGYAITMEAAPVATAPAFEGVQEVRLCGFGANVNTAPSSALFLGCKNPASEPSANDIALITNPTRCVGTPPTVTLRVDSWENPNVFKSATSVDPMPEGCEKIDFLPEMDLRPTSNQADSPTGMDVEITMDPSGAEGKNKDGTPNPDATSEANLKRVTVTLPEGMAANPSAGQGLGACSTAQIGIHPLTGVPNDQEARCPLASKIGTVAIDTPLIQETLTGDIFLAEQGAGNPFGSLMAMYLVFTSKKDGITIKVAGKVTPDPQTGRLVVRFDDNPEAPFSRARFHFFQHPRSPLVNPPRCGTYEIEAELTPWSADDPSNPSAEEVVIQKSSFEVTTGPGGGPCPDMRFDPKFEAGTLNPIAGQPSPFVMRLSRDDGTQRFTGLSLAPPLGLTAYLKGVAICPQGAIDALKANTAFGVGRAELANPSCPAGSQVGSAVAGAGAGTNPLYVDTGRAYLAGPYNGAPLSLVVVTPAVAGPFDLGTVVTQVALHIDPVTAQITAVSDPIPHILHGIPLNVRDVRVRMDRPGFTLNPTSCQPKQVSAEVSGLGGASASLANRFQVSDCAALGFAPRVNLRLVGGTKRGGHPSLRAVVRPRPGDANIRRAAVTMPNSAFLDQANIRTICTRVQWANDNCPKAAQYGFARAWSPLLDQPLQGPVYLRSSDNLLPDLVADLRGPAHQPIRIEAAFRTDSIRGGIRSTIDFAPDAPVSRFVLRMQGGKRKGLIVNSRDICRGTNRANSRMIGHNGRRANTRPKVHAANCGKARKGAKAKGGKSTARVHRMKAVGR